MNSEISTTTNDNFTIYFRVYYLCQNITINVNSERSLRAACLFVVGFPVIKGMLEVDCSRENSGIERLRQLIKDVLDRYRSSSYKSNVYVSFGHNCHSLKCYNCLLFSFKIKGQSVMGQKIPASYVVSTQSESESESEKTIIQVQYHRL